MAAIYTYPDVQTLAADMANEVRVWTKFGRLDQLAINATDPTEDGFIFLFYRKFNQRYGDLIRFSHSTAEFITVEFSSELPGMTIFLNETPGNTVTMWDALSGPTKDTYKDRADALMSQNLLSLQWPTAAQLV